MICDRAGSQALRDDTTGASFHDVCHTDASGNFASRTVDLSNLPELDPSARDVKETGHVGAAGDEPQASFRAASRPSRAGGRTSSRPSMSRSRTSRWVRRISSADPKKSCEPGKTSEADLRTELADMLGRMSDLYNDGTVPHFTRALSRSCPRSKKSPRLRPPSPASTRVWLSPKTDRVGHRASGTAYPHIVDLANALLRLVSADTDPLGVTTKADGPSDRAARERTPGKATLRSSDCSRPCARSFVPQNELRRRMLSSRARISR